MVRICFQRVTYLIAIAGMACVFGGCSPIPMSRHPLSDQTDSQIDKELLGRWEFIDEDSSHQGYIDVRIDADNAKRFEFEFIGNDSSEKSKLVAYAAELYGQKYLSVNDAGNKEFKGYVLLQYQVSEDAAVLYVMNENYIVDSIEKKQIAGEMKRSDETNAREITEIMLTAKPAELRRYLGDHSGSAFDLAKPLVLSRVKDKQARITLPARSAGE